MNNIYKTLKILLISLSPLFLFSCESDLLEKDPLTSLSSASFWESQEDIEAALAGVYSHLQEDFLGYERVYFDALTNNAWAGNDENFNQQNLFEITIGSISPSLTGAIQNMYSAPYKAITGCNLFLDNVDKAKENISENDLELFKAEVRFIRALAYFDLVQLFGDVIIYDKYFSTIDDAKIAKSSMADVYAFIENDLNFAISVLPDKKYEGHAVKGSAQALLGRVLLVQEKWQDAATVLKSVIDGGQFGIYGNFRDLFLASGQADRNNKEILFSTRYLAPNVQNSRSGMEIELGWWFLMQPLGNLADSYQMIDGLVAESSPLFDDSHVTTRYKNRDPRLDLSMRLPGEYWITTSGDSIFDDRENQTGFVIEKYLDLSKLPFKNSTANVTDQDLIHLRYADVLLMYAEAQNEYSGPDATVYQAINEVRARDGINMPAVDEGVYNTKESLREFIRNERRVELAFEGLHYFDLKRWKTAVGELNGLELPGGAKMIFEERNYYLPFSQSEIDINTNLTQNPDY